MSECPHHQRSFPLWLAGNCISSGSRLIASLSSLSPLTSSGHFKMFSRMRNGCGSNPNAKKCQKMPKLSKMTANAAPRTRIVQSLPPHLKPEIWHLKITAAFVHCDGESHPPQIARKHGGLSPKMKNKYITCYNHKVWYQDEFKIKRKHIQTILDLSKYTISTDPHRSITHFVRLNLGACLQIPVQQRGPKIWFLRCFVYVYTVYVHIYIIIWYNYIWTIYIYTCIHVPVGFVFVDPLNYCAVWTQSIYTYIYT